ncbi:MAG TPA: glycosyltransferase [Casimicrobiaceae bacterium]|nr:glycosyltransferase [Casimicrobiaceae bacterium]
MHLLDVTMLYAPQSGGVVRYLRAKHAWLRRHTSIRHSLLVPGAADARGASGEIYLRTRSLSPHAHRWPLAGRRWSRAIRDANPDLIEVGDAGPEAWAALHAARTLDVPLIAFCHSDIVRMAARRLGKLPGTATRFYGRAFYRRCDLVIAPSAFMQRELNAWGVERVVARPLGVDTDLFSPRRRVPGLRRELGLPPRVRLLGYAGRFSTEKNTHVLLDAFRRLGARYHLVLAGPQIGVPLPPNVTSLPFLHSSLELARVLASVDGFVHAGDQETFGLVVVEAMACGRGIVAPCAGAFPEIVTPQTGVLVAPNDADALAEGVRAFYGRDPAALGRAARARAESEYGWDSAMHGLLGLYRGALASTCSDAPRYAVS